MVSTPSSPTRIEKTLSKRSEIVINLVMIVLGPIFLLGLLELVSFIWEQRQAQGVFAWELVASRRIDLIEFTEPGAGYTLMKSGSQYNWQGIPVTVNSHGFRDSEFAYKKPDNTFRILNLGDSVAMGWGVKVGETYGKQLEAMLNQNTAGSLRYEVLNAGVPGWNLENELAYLQEKGLKHNPDLVLLDITLVNDIYGQSALKNTKRSEVIEWLRENTYSYPFLSVQLRSLQARLAGRNRIDVIDPPVEAASYFPLDPNAKRWEEAWELISQMHTLTTQRGIDFIVVLFPLEYQVLDEQYSTLPQELLLAKAQAAGIPTLDLLPSFRSACLEKPGGTCSLEDRYLFADVWMHPSALGHQITASEIVETFSVE